MVLSSLPKQDYEHYARTLNKRDGQSVRYRWKVILRKARGQFPTPFFLMVEPY